MTDTNRTEKDGGIDDQKRARGHATLPAWPERAIFHEEAGESKPGEKSQLETQPLDELSGLSSRHSQRSPRAHSPNKSRSRQSSSASSWRALKSLDIVSFNAGAESHFVLWLARKLESEDFGAVSIGWVLQNAAFELDVSIETVKRYLGKHTAELAEFHSDGKVVTLRS